MYAVKIPKPKQTDNTIEKHTEEDPIHITNFAVAFQNTILRSHIKKCLFRPEAPILSENTVLWESMTSSNFALILYSKTHK